MPRLSESARATRVRALLADGAFRHLRENGVGTLVCDWLVQPDPLRLEVGPRDGLVPATCLWCVAALVRSP